MARVDWRSKVLKQKRIVTIAVGGGETSLDTKGEMEDILQDHVRLMGHRARTGSSELRWS